MSSSSSEEEFELNYLKIDSKNEIRLLGKEDYEIEMIAYLCAVNEYKDENIGKKLSEFLKKIPESDDILKLNSDYSRQFSKLLNADKKKSLYNSINTLLSIDFKDTFIFNKSNLYNVSIILANCFLELKEMKKYKITTAKELKNAISKINFEKLDFFNIFANNEYLKNKEKERQKDKIKEKEKEKLMDISSSRASTQCRSTTFSSYGPQVKDLYEDICLSELEENILGSDSINRYHNEAKGLYYIDNNSKNIMCSSMLSSDYNYNGEEKKNKLLTKECFIYPKCHKNEILEQNNTIPVELLLLLSKLRTVKTLVFQLQRVDEQFLKMAIFILLNVKWLFMKGIREVKFDLGNEEMQNALCELFKERTAELYYHFQKNLNSIYYSGSYKARTINCWEPEGDIYFEKYPKEETNKKNNYLYHIQPLEETSTFDNHLCNIYNEFGNLTNLKYIRPIVYSNKNKIINDSPNDISIDYNNNFEALTLNESVSDIPKSERDSISSTNSFNISKLNQNLSKTFNNTHSKNPKNSIGKGTPKIITKFVNKYKLYLEMIPIYSYFLSKNINKLNSLSLYFHTPYLYEICQFFNMNLHFDNSHFLIYAKEIDCLKEANFSFNSLDDKSFQYIIGIIDNNIKISSLKLSFFTPDINYYDNSLFNLISSKNISLTKLFQDEKEFEIKFKQKRENMNKYILNEKLLGPFATNLCSFLNLLKMKTLNNLEEFIMRFDIPLPLLDNEKYNILLIKFIINILIMLTFQENKINTFKILAPDLSLNCSNMPYIRQLFKEILIKDIIQEKFKDENEKNIKKVRKKNRQKTIKEQKEKEKEIELKLRRKELKEKFERKELLERIESKDKINLTKKEKDDDMEFDKQLEKILYKRNHSMTHKVKKESAPPIFEFEEITSKKRSELNTNSSLQNLILQLKIYDLPEIFNLCLMNNIIGIKCINLGILDEVTFIGFMNDFKTNYNKFQNLASLKISLGTSVTNYINVEKYIFDYININPPKIEEKFLFSDLKLTNETKMRQLIELVYMKATVPKLVMQIGYENEHILSKVLYKFTNERKTELSTLALILSDIPEYKQLYNQNILECLVGLYSFKKNRAILCKENPDINN